jgi:hypothetical protein
MSSSRLILHVVGHGTAALSVAHSRYRYRVCCTPGPGVIHPEGEPKSNMSPRFSGARVSMYYMYHHSHRSPQSSGSRCIISTNSTKDLVHVL